MTYSVVLRDAASGVLGVACQSHFFAVGSVVPWAEAGVGAVATQAFLDPGYGPRALAAMRSGAAAADALEPLVAGDPLSSVRQVAVVDAEGRVASHTGASCVGSAGVRHGEGWSVQGNMLASAGVLDAMADAVLDAEGDVPARLLAALEAAESAGGDGRGSQAAALLAVGGARDEQPWSHVVADLRVDDSPQPVAELARLLATRRAFDDVLPAFAVPGVVVGTFDDGARDAADRVLAGLERASASLDGVNPEADLWRAVVLARAGRPAEAASAFAAAVEVHPPLREFLPMLTAAGCIPQEAAAHLARGGQPSRA